LTFGRASFNPASDEYFRCRLHLSARGCHAARRERAKEKDEATAASPSPPPPTAPATSTAAAAAAATSAAIAAKGAAWLLLCIGGPCPGELSTRNDPRESKKMQTPSQPMDYHLFLLSLPLFFSCAAICHR